MQELRVHPEFASGWRVSIWVLPSTVFTEERHGRKLLLKTTQETIQTEREREMGVERVKVSSIEEEEAMGFLEGEQGPWKSISLPAGGRGASLEGHFWEKLAYSHRAEKEA